MKSQFFIAIGVRWRGCLAGGLLDVTTFCKTAGGTPAPPNPTLHGDMRDCRLVSLFTFLVNSWRMGFANRITYEAPQF